MLLRSLVTDVDDLVAQVDGRFVADVSEAEGVVLFYFPSCLGIEEFVGRLGRRKEADAREVDAKAIDGFHAEGVVKRGVVLIFDPEGELPIEQFERRQVELACQELVADSAEESFDLPLGGGVAHRGMTKDATDAGTDERDLLRRVDRSVVDEQLLGNAPLVEGGAERLDQRIDVFFEEELAMTENSAGIIDEGDQLGLLLHRAVGHEGSEHGVGLPELIGVLHAEGQATLVVGDIGFEKIVFADEAVEGRRGDLFSSQQPPFDAEAINARLVIAFFVEVRQRGVDRLHHFFRRDFSKLAFVLSRLARHPSDAMNFVAVVPGLDGSPGEGSRVAFFVDEGHGSNVADSLVPCSALHGVDGAEDAHLEVDRRLFHEASPCCRPLVPGEGGLHRGRFASPRRLALLAISRRLSDRSCDENLVG
jgi:hypothetical protein